MKKIISLTLCLVIGSFLLVSCGKLSQDEAKEKVKELVSASYELNVIYFGSGLEFEDDGDQNSSYAPVKETAPYKTKAELEKRTYEIFTKDYAKSMIDTAFYGVTGASAGFVPPRYSVYVGGEDNLTVYKKIEGEKISSYDFNTVEITKNSSRFIVADVTNSDGIKVSVTLFCEDGEWKIDSATY